MRSKGHGNILADGTLAQTMHRERQSASVVTRVHSPAPLSRLSPDQSCLQAAFQAVGGNSASQMAQATKERNKGKGNLIEHPIVNSRSPSRTEMLQSRQSEVAIKQHCTDDRTEHKGEWTTH